MIRRRVLIDIEFAVDETQFKIARLAEDPSGVSDVTDDDVREVVTSHLLDANWGRQGLAPQRSIVTTRSSTPRGEFEALVVPPDLGVVAP